jgi:hypothetical protein
MPFVSGEGCPFYNSKKRTEYTPFLLLNISEKKRSFVLDH